MGLLDSLASSSFPKGVIIHKRRGIEGDKDIDRICTVGINANGVNTVPVSLLDIGLCTYILSLRFVSSSIHRACGIITKAVLFLYMIYSPILSFFNSMSL